MRNNLIENLLDPPLPPIIKFKPTEFSWATEIIIVKMALEGEIR
jgi:hypothetical protein